MLRTACGSDGKRIMKSGGIMMKRFLKKAAAVMGVSLAACGSGTASAGGEGSAAAGGESAAAGGTVTEVNVCIPTAYDMPDAGEVETAINEIAESKYGVHLNLTFVSMGNWLQQSNLLLTGDEVDVIAAFMTPLTTYVKNGQLAPLDDYYASAADDFKAIWSEEEIKGTTVDGQIYAIPNLRNFGNRFGLNIDKAIAEEFGIEPYHKWSLEEIDAFLHEVHEKYPDRYALVPQSGDTMVNGWTWDGLGDGKFIGVIPDCGQGTEVQNLFDTDDFQEFIGWTRKWYQDGLIMADALSNTEAGSQLIANQKAVSCFDNYANNELAGAVRTVVIEPWSVANSYSELCYGINANSKNKDAAWTALQMLYTDKDVCVLLNNGIEGKHYTKNDDGTISFPEGKTAADCGYGMADLYWIAPYSGWSNPIDYNGPTFFEDLIQFNKDTMKSKAYGFFFDTSSVVDQYSACSNVMDKYYKALLAGTVDPESTIAQANGELEAAGLQDILTEKQKQLDDFFAQK